MAEQTIDLNTADAEELTSLSGIGPVLAQRIVSHRETAGPYMEPADVLAVSGIGERTYGAIADRLTATGPVEDLSPMAGEGPAREEEAVGEESGARSASVGEETEGGRTDGAIDAISPEVPVGDEDHSPERGPGEGARDAMGQPRPAREQEAGEDEGLGEALHGSMENEAFRASPSRQERRALSWLWIAVAGGLLGMVFALIAFAGINGSLDVGHSRAVLGIEADVDALTRDLDALSVDVEGLGRRVEALEGLKTRMDNVEASVDELRQEMSVLQAQTDALEGEIDGLSRELEAVAEDVAALQQEAERTRSFFQGLQGLLIDVFGAADAESSPTATPEGK